jgi:SAM-dependent methyltransferase
MSHRRPWLRQPVPPNFDELVAMLAYLPDPGVELYARVASKMPPHLLISPPHKFGELGWLIDGHIATYDTFYYLQRIALLYEAGLLDRLARISALRSPRILEIGGGFGGLAHHLSKLHPRIRYTIVDIPESLAFSSVYLSVLHPTATIDLIRPDGPSLQHAEFRLCPNFLIDEMVLDGGDYDLVINTASLNEMAPAQVAFYATRIARVIGDEGVFFEHNGEANKFGLQSLRSLLRTHFPNGRRCPSTIVGADMSPPEAYLWSR